MASIAAASRTFSLPLMTALRFPCRINPKVGAVLNAILYRGELPRSEVSGLLGGLGDRQSRRLLEPLTKTGVLLAESTRAPLRLGFPAALAGRWMPGLFPEQVQA